MEVARGEVWWADLGEPQGSEPGGVRPVVIVSSDIFNFGTIRTVTVAAVTSNVRLANAPGNVLLRAPENGLDRPSVVNVSQIAAIDRSRLREPIGHLLPEQSHALDDGLRLALAL
jgi:mRNA interferase MazF